MVADLSRTICTAGLNEQPRGHDGPGDDSRGTGTGAVEDVASLQQAANRSEKPRLLPLASSDRRSAAIMAG